jgi:hypothetical protein
MFSSIRRAENRRLDFRPFRMLVDSTRRKSLIRWQKLAAMWEHGFDPVGATISPFTYSAIFRSALICAKCAML